MKDESSRLWATEVFEVSENPSRRSVLRKILAKCEHCRGVHSFYMMGVSFYLYEGDTQPSHWTNERTPHVRNNDVRELMCYQAEPMRQLTCWCDVRVPKHLAVIVQDGSPKISAFWFISQVLADANHFRIGDNCKVFAFRFISQSPCWCRPLPK